MLIIEEPALVGVWLFIFDDSLFNVVEFILLLLPVNIINYLLFTAFSLLFFSFSFDLCLSPATIDTLYLYYFLPTISSSLTNPINWFNAYTFTFKPPINTNLTNSFIILFVSNLIYNLLISLLYVVISSLLFESNNKRYFYNTWLTIYYINWLLTNVYMHLINKLTAFNNCPGFFSSRCSHNIVMYFLALRFISNYALY